MFGFSKEDDYLVGAYDQNARQQVLAVLLATAFSLILHAYLFMHFPQMKFEVLQKPDHTMQSRPIELSEVVYGEVAGVRPDGREFVDAGGTSFPHAADTVDEFIRSVNNWIDETASIKDHQFTGENAPLAAPSAAPEREAWTPRQQILQVEDRVVEDRLAMLPRRLIPRTQRSRSAPDVSMGIQRGFASRSLARSTESFTASRMTIEPIGPSSVGGSLAPQAVSVPENLAGLGGVVADESDQTVSRGIKALDNFITVNVYTTHSKSDPEMLYFRAEINRAGEDILPVLPKDIILMQDCSASMTEQKLYFCRQGLTRALASLGPKDRFNIVGFREGAETCFKKLTSVNEASLKKAQGYIRDMSSRGGTDIFRSLEDILKIKPTNGRPLMALIITDGLPTTGVTDSSSIIARFSALNDGRMSVFTMGTVKTANNYLLDMLSYRNKGDSLVVKRGRWDIPDSVTNRVFGMSRPVLTDLQFQFASASHAEVYPHTISDLYLDRPLVLYGKIPRAMPRMVFRVVGQAGRLPCDMAFEYNMSDAVEGESSIRQDWAWQKIYHLIGEHTRTRQSGALRDIRLISRDYNIRVPYAGIISARQ